MNAARAIVFATLLFNFGARADDNLVTVIDGVPTNLGTFASTGSNNVLVVTNGGSAVLTSIAAQSSASNNAVFVVGAGSALSGGGSTLTFANAGVSNAIVFRDGGSVSGSFKMGGTNNHLVFENTSSTVSFNASGVSNLVELSNATLGGSFGFNSTSSDYLVSGSTWTMGSFGLSSASNSIMVFNAGSQALASGWTQRGLPNTLRVSDPNSLWKVTGSTTVQNLSSGPGHSIQIAAGARADLQRFDFGVASSLNNFEADGAGTEVSIAKGLYIGTKPGNSNVFLISNGAHLHTDTASLSDGSFNWMTITGTGSTWDCTNAVQLTGPTNRLEILDGAVAACGALSNTGQGNTVAVGSGSQLTVAGDFSSIYGMTFNSGGSITAGGFKGTGTAQRFEISAGSSLTVRTNFTFVNLSTSSNILVVRDGGHLRASSLLLGGDSGGRSNFVNVAGIGSSLTATSIIAGEVGQRIKIESGGRLTSASYVSQKGLSSVEVTGAGSIWENSGDVQTAIGGVDPVNENIIISGGATATNANATIGIYQDASISVIRTFSALTVDGANSKWITAGNLMIGRNGNSNAFALSNGASASVSNLTVGFYVQPNTSVQAGSGSSNLFKADGIASALVASGDIRLGYGSSGNRFIISHGAAVSARNFIQGGAPNNQPKFFAFTVGEDAVELMDEQSSLILSGDFTMAKFSSRLTMTNLARLEAGGTITLGSRTGIGGNAQVHAGVSIQSPGLDVLVTNAHLSAPIFQMSANISSAHTRFAGAQALLECDTLLVSDLNQSLLPASSAARFEALAGATVTCRSLSIGLDAPTNIATVNIDGGVVRATAPDGSGLLEMKRGVVTLHHGRLETDQAILHGSDAMIQIDGALMIGGSATAGDGDMHITSKLLLEQGGKAQVATTVNFAAGSELAVMVGSPYGESKITATGAVTLGGRLTILLSPTNPLATGASFPLIHAASIAGNFDNAAPGQRISTADNSGSFRIDLSATDLVLADFAPTPFALAASLDTASSALVLTYAANAGVTIQSSTNLVDWAPLPNPVIQTINGQSQTALQIDPSQPQNYFRLVK